VTTLRRPCDNCPWRVDAPRGFWDPSHFEEIYRNCQDDGMHVMLCHKSKPGKIELPCQGWARVMGTAAIGVRILLIKGTLTIAEVMDRRGQRLFRTFAAMLRANKIELPERNKVVR
jgi:Family of unknown function (DUF6283)